MPDATQQYNMATDRTQITAGIDTSTSGYPAAILFGVLTKPADRRLSVSIYNNTI